MYIPVTFKQINCKLTTTLHLYGIIVSLLGVCVITGCDSNRWPDGSVPKVFPVELPLDSSGAVDSIKLGQSFVADTIPSFFPFEKPKIRHVWSRAAGLVSQHVELFIDSGNLTYVYLQTEEEKVNGETRFADSVYASTLAYLQQHYSEPVRYEQSDEIAVIFTQKIDETTIVEVRKMWTDFDCTVSISLKRSVMVLFE